MCGIGGIVGGPEPPRELLERMASAMTHRGPDGEGIWSGQEAGFAFRRLAIIDLHERSNQPLALGPWRLVFNGEIYNFVELRHELRGLGHEFVTEGDGEVLLHAWDEWGEGSLNRLNGMFALAVWHTGERRLLLASDPFGEKPLYWWEGGGQLVFASDIPAIVSVRPEAGAPRDSAVQGFLAEGVMPPIGESFFERIQRLPGAHLLRWHDGRVEIDRYWAPAPREVPPSLAAAAEELRELLRDSVRLRLRSDVPVGTSLSGGVDSSTIVMLSASLAEGHERQAFTAGFPGFDRDEAPLARLVAEVAEVRQHRVVEPTVCELLHDLDAVVRAQQEPFGSLSIYAQWRVMRAAREAGVVVLLDGQGADELFGGYRAVPGWAFRSMPPAAALHELLRGGLTRTDLAVGLLAGRVPARLAQRRRLGMMSPYVTADVSQGALRTGPPEPDPAPNPLIRELLRQTRHTSLPELLRYADRDSMAQSREVRLPFLDRRIAELAFSLPPEYLFRGGVSKLVLREAMRGVVPAPVLERRDKVGFEPPQHAWLSSPQGFELAREVLLDQPARSRGVHDIAAIEQDIRDVRWRNHGALWRALSVELWFAGCVGSSGRTRASLPPAQVVGG